MTYSLLIGDRSYSSWSLRAWLLFEKFAIPVSVQKTRMYDPKFSLALEAYAPARTVPVVRIDDEITVSDTLAIAETLAEAHPEAGFWPKDRRARGLARSMSAEMHSAFTALRSAHPMNLSCGFVDVPVSASVAVDLARIDHLWSLAMTDHDGPWLFGRYCIADAMFAPVAARIAAYGLAVSDASQAYVQTVISDAAFLKWRRLGLKDAAQSVYDMPYAVKDWPGPA